MGIDANELENRIKDHREVMDILTSNIGKCVIDMIVTSSLNDLSGQKELSNILHRFADVVGSENPTFGDLFAINDMLIAWMNSKRVQYDAEPILGR